MFSSMGEFGLRRNKAPGERVHPATAKATYVTTGRCTVSCARVSTRWSVSRVRVTVGWNRSGMFSPYRWLHRSIHCSSLWVAPGRWRNNNSVKFSRSSSVIPVDSEAVHTVPIQHSNLPHSWASMSNSAIFRASVFPKCSAHGSETASSTSKSQYQWDKRWVPSGDQITAKRSDDQLPLLPISSTAT